MGTYKKASRRLVQPRPEHYKDRLNQDGKTESLLCGPYSLEQRDAWFELQISLHQTRHPNGPRSQARRAAMMKWRMLVFATIGDEYVPVKDIKDVKRNPDSVVLLKDRPTRQKA